MNNRPSKDQRGVVFVSHKASYTADDLRALFDELVTQMRELGMPPTELAGSGAGWPRMLRQFDRNLKRVLRAGFGDLTHFGLRHLKPERDQLNWGFFDWSAVAGVAVEDSVKGLTSGWRVDLTLFPDDAGVPEDLAEARLVDFARRHVQEYGYVARTTRRGYMYGVGFGNGDGRGAWMDTIQYHLPFPILRDIYLVNILGKNYQQLPVGNQTLLEWIRANQNRGSIENMNSGLVMWRPPPDQIPAIRESLFRAGLVLYFGFFDPTSPCYRNAFPPAPVHAEIPATFKASTYVGQDPSVIM